MNHTVHRTLWQRALWRRGVGGVATLLATLLVAAPSFSGVETGDAPETSSEYVVKRGDTLYSIGREYGLSVREISRANRIRNPHSIDAGDRLVLPGVVLTKVAPLPVSAPPPPIPGGRPAVSAPARAAHESSPPVSGANRPPPEPVPPVSAPPPLQPARRIDRLVEQARVELQEARFEEALTTAGQGLRNASSRDRAQRAELEVITATAQVALGRRIEAEESFERALTANPELTLERSDTSPKVFDVYEAARRRLPD